MIVINLKDDFYESMQNLDGNGITAMLDMIRQIIVNSGRLGEDELEEIEEMVKEKEVGGMLSRLLGSTLEEGKLKDASRRKETTYTKSLKHDLAMFRRI